MYKDGIIIVEHYHREYCKFHLIKVIVEGSEYSISVLTDSIGSFKKDEFSGVGIVNHYNDIDRFCNEIGTYLSLDDASRVKTKIIFNKSTKKSYEYSSKSFMKKIGVYTNGAKFRHDIIYYIKRNMTTNSLSPTTDNTLIADVTKEDEPIIEQQLVETRIEKLRRLNRLMNKH